MDGFEKSTPTRVLADDFTLPGFPSETGPGDFKQRRNIVLAFLESDCSECRELMLSLAGSKADLEYYETVVIGVTRSREQAEEMSGETGFRALYDENGRVFKIYGLEGRRWGIVVLDRYGALYGSWLEGSDDLPEASEILNGLKHIEIECPECGVYQEPPR